MVSRTVKMGFPWLPQLWPARHIPRSPLERGEGGGLRAQSQSQLKKFGWGSFRKCVGSAFLANAFFLGRQFWFAFRFRVPMSFSGVVNALTEFVNALTEVVNAVTEVVNALTEVVNALTAQNSR